MELEFDKEIDAILRRSRGGLAVAANGEHLDADAISAFAEGAIPERSRPVHTRHLADCDRCRKLLSQAISLNTAAVLAADQAASSVDAPVGGFSSWINNLFRAPNLALAMGALVLTFSGVLGYLVLRNQQADTAMVSQSDTEMQKGGPSAGIELNEQIANSNAASTAANTSANAAASDAPASSVATNSAFGDVGRTDSVTQRSIDNLPVNGRDADKSVLLDGVTAPEPKPVTAAPPPAVDKPVSEKDEEKLKSGDDAVKDEKNREVVGGVRQEAEDRAARGNVALAKKKDGGPTRSAGPVQSPSLQNNQTNEMPVTRAAGGKKFTNRSGAWYDTAYRGQATTNVRRGTDAYKSLDSGLRSIADNLGGTVVVVWKDKAYRIQ